jgi:uncharacterized protein YjiS (DUF1127 family)
MGNKMSTIDTFGGSTAASAASLEAAHVNFVRRLAESTLGAAKWFSEAMLKRRTRHTLRELPDELLRDIGITRAEAMREAKRPFWE